MKRPRTAQQRVEELLESDKVIVPDDDDDDDDKWYHDDHSLDDDNEYQERRVGSLSARNARTIEDERYAGKTVSRKKMKIDKGDFDDEDDDDEKEDHTELGNLLDAGDDDEDEDEDEDQEEDQEEDEELDDDESMIVAPRGSSSSEASKGEAIVAQQKLFERLLSLRIQLQKLLTRLNRFPEPQLLKESLNTSAMPSAKLKETVANLEQLSKLLNDLKAKQADCQDQTAFRDQVLNKWSERTRLTSSNMKRGSSSLSSSSMVVHLRTTLEDNMEHLVRRTRVQRSDYRILGEEKTSDQDPTSLEDASKGGEERVEIFDDDDFYHLLLRELIAQKTSEADDENGIAATMLWLQMQRNNRKKKKRANIDTRASKGRKLRYDIHAKLVNFMAPMYSKQSMSDVARNELLGSLFGIKHNENNGGCGEERVEKVQHEEEEDDEDDNDEKEEDDDDDEENENEEDNDNCESDDDNNDDDSDE